MFTGIVAEVGTVAEMKPIEGGREITINCSFAGDTHIDESIAVNGVCLTVVDFNDEQFRIQAVDETLRKTSIGDLKEGSVVNLERSLTLEKGIEGHIVQGHVDTTGTISEISQDGADLLVTVEYPEEHKDLIVGRGSIAIDGISLTVAREEENRFTVAIIPYTWDHTNLRDKKAGDSVNLEFDIFGKYIVRYLKNREGK
ncbi:MAG: riboflavin synthase [Balneolaceae bacterium]|nr:riboflavin synthase [Balneolaceae bacterium]MCH8548688.1 riboflavin synthase [Balneolaceae bacterium]